MQSATDTSGWEAPQQPLFPPLRDRWHAIFSLAAALSAVAAAAAGGAPTLPEVRAPPHLSLRSPHPRPLSRRPPPLAARTRGRHAVSRPGRTTFCCDGLVYRGALRAPGFMHADAPCVVAAE